MPAGTQAGAGAPVRTSPLNSSSVERHHGVHLRHCLHCHQRQFRDDGPTFVRLATELCVTSTADCTAVIGKGTNPRKRCRAVLPPPRRPCQRPERGTAALMRRLLFLTLLASMASVPLVSGQCLAPYASLLSKLTWQVAPGAVRDFPAGLTVAVGEVALIHGTARVTGGVTIRGKLFLSSNSSSTLSAGWIAVESGGTLQAGSQACPLPKQVTATILLKNGAVHPTAGRKALAVMAGGTLEVRGSRLCCSAVVACTPSSAYLQALKAPAATPA